MHLHLIRHGKTDANEKSLYCGASDLPLSDKGKSELLALKERGIYPTSADLYFTSSMKRAKQTLDILYGSVPSESMPQLSEYNFGEFEMKCHDELELRDDYQNWIFDDSGQTPCPGGESRQDFNRRISEGFDILYKNALNQLQPEVATPKAPAPVKEKSTLVICHGGVIVQIMDTLFPNKHNFYEWLPETGRGYTLICTATGFETYRNI